MGTTAIVSAILTLLSGIGIFLIACQMMSSNLESASSAKLKSLFAKASKSKLLGVGIGTVGTAAIQSSGATTVMTIGFVNAGIGAFLALFSKKVSAKTMGGILAGFGMLFFSSM